MPCWELFEEQDRGVPRHVLPPDVTARVAVEQASTFGWAKYVGHHGRHRHADVRRFGAAEGAAEKFGFTIDASPRPPAISWGNPASMGLAWTNPPGDSSSGKIPLLFALSPHALRLGPGRAARPHPAFNRVRECRQVSQSTHSGMGEIIMVIKRTRLVCMGAFSVVAMGMVLSMATGLHGQPPSVSPAITVLAAGESLETWSPTEHSPDLVIHEWGTFLGNGAGRTAHHSMACITKNTRCPRSFIRGVAINCGLPEA